MHKSKQTLYGTPSPRVVLVNLCCTGMPENEINTVNALYRTTTELMLPRAFVGSVLSANIYQRLIGNTGLHLVILIVYVYRPEK